MKRTHAELPAALALAMLMAGCNTKTDTSTAGGSVVENEVVAGTILLADGTPAPNAEVKVFSVDHVPDVIAAPKRGSVQAPDFATHTDAKGRYSLPGLPKGEYNILAQKGALASYQDSVFLSATPKSLDPDTLKSTGTLSGWVKLQPNHSPESVTLQALGTNTFANADADGRFTLGPLAEGRYTVRVITTEEKYTPLYTSLDIRSGSSDTLADTLRPVFTGIPVVTGLKAVFDTANGVVTLSWNKARYTRIQNYQVLRNQAAEVVPNPVVLASLMDTVYRDTVFLSDAITGKDGAGPGSDSLIRTLQYRVRVVDQSDQPGLTFGKAEVAAPSPYFVRTVLAFDGQNLTAGKPIANRQSSIDDSLRLNVWFSNPTRRIKELRWFQGTGTASVKTLIFDPPLLAGSASLAYRTGSTPGTVAFRVEVVEETGRVVKAGMTLEVLQDAPVALAGADTLVKRNATVRLHGKAGDGFGRIVKWEWDIGGTGNFKVTSGPDTAFTAPGVFGSQPCILRVTDDDGNAGLDTLEVIASLQFTEVQAQTSDRFAGRYIGQQTLVFQDKLWCLGGLSERKSAYLPLNASSADGMHWEAQDSASVFTNRVGHGALVYRGKMWVLGGKALTPVAGSPSPDFTRGNAYDVWSSADGRTWDRVTEGDFPGVNGFATVVFQDKMWTLGGLVLTSHPDGSTSTSDAGVWYSQDGATWTQPTSTSPLPLLQGPTAVAFAGKIWVLGGQLTGGSYVVPSKEVWNSADGVNWNKVTTNAPIGSLSGHASLVYGGRIWVLGGNAGRYVGNYGDPSSAQEISRKIWYSGDGISWQSLPNPDSSLPGVGFSAADFKEKLWMLFGEPFPPDLANQFSDRVWQAE